MKHLLTILVAALAAFGARSFTQGSRASAARTLAQGRTSAAELGGLLADIEALRARNQGLAHELESRENVLVAAAAPVDEPGERDIAAALERWRAAHPAEARDVAEHRSGRARPSADEADFARVPMSELVALLSRESLSQEERQQLFQRLRDAGRIDEYVAAIEKLCEQDPKNADLQVALGNAYLQKLFGIGSGPEAGRLAMKSDQAFDRALAIDDHNWAARFIKAVALSNWPAFLGKGPIAIENFETLIEQQAEVQSRPEFAMTYLFLGNVYQANGDKDKALATWRAGLERFPERQELQQALALALANESGGQR